MRTNFKLIVSTGSGGHGCPKTASVACNIPESGPRQQQQQQRPVPVPVPVPVAVAIAAPTSASAWHWFSDRHWPGLAGTLRNRPFAAVKENDCNYASLFLNFHAVHLPRLWLLLLLLPMLLLLLPTILAWEVVEDLDTELDPQDKQVCCCGGLL